MQPQRDHLTSVALAALIITLGSSRIPLTRLSANNENKYDYLPLTVNICAEAIKFTICLLLSLQLLYKEGRAISEIFVSPPNNQLHVLKWSIPGLLYFLDNLLGFYSLTYLEPAVVVLLNNFVIISTSLLFRFILKRHFTKIQWASIMILFLAIVSLSNDSSHGNSVNHNSVNHMLMNLSTKSDHVILCSYEKHSQNKKLLPQRNILKAKTQSTRVDDKLFNMGHLLIIISCFVASFANIYNEKIFKEEGGLQESIYFQNTKLYMFGIFFNFILLVLHSDYRQRVLKCGFFDGYNIYSSILIFDVAFLGLTVSLILKFKDNMFHIFSTQIMTVVVITFSIYQFGYNPTLNFYLQAPIVLLSIYIYNVSKYSHNGGHETHTYNLVEEEDEQDVGKFQNQNGIISDQIELHKRRCNSESCGCEIEN
ncbi:probable UDP-sugar transporter protein SLC35A5 [Anneissia japonica]|uniref:probable UDP-sugar transporter protein SLC35A5 n=1 Tax=Anneissia japonica TaxID=1529436 RepID=UPI0014256D79|nr:probable UDP-sugar transporter protein SLC35A5 [Anneissia japonica]XP_033122695.1 probable UDP-sugar transporter protein SLC35A5 [Anneissia japonica]